MGMGLAMATPPQMQPAAALKQEVMSGLAHTNGRSRQPSASMFSFFDSL